MSVRRALLVGAGISAGPPASLPLGRKLDDVLRRCCFEAALQVAPGAVDMPGLAAVSRLQRNLLTRLAACAGRSAINELLQCFRVTVPNESHVLAAVHALRGTLLLTLNFDDGIETAYGLLGGAVQLPSGAPGDFHHALAAWQHMVRPTAPLRVVGSRFARVDLDHQPLLVRLRGSTVDGWHQSIIPHQPVSEIDAQQLTDDQMGVLRAAAQMQYLAIAGVSGVDADCRAALLPLLRLGRFSWTSAALDPDLVALLRQIDSSQPRLRPALEGVRSMLPDADTLPAWPQTLVSRAKGFDDNFARWRARLSPMAAAETYAWLLSETGLHDQAIAVHRAVLARRRLH